MTGPLRRTLVVRFAATMAAGLVVASAAIWVAASRVLRHQLDQGNAAWAFVAARELAPTSQCAAGDGAVTLDAIA
ncbi:MAG TPA: hypothetical protein VIW26_07235, partial [Gemmatimonadales bacterium]